MADPRPIGSPLSELSDRVDKIEDRLKEGGPGGTSGGMNDRVTALEVHMGYMQRDTAEIKADLKTLIERTADLPTKRDLDSWRWQWIATGLAIVALTIGGITGGLALIAHFAG